MVLRGGPLAHQAGSNRTTSASVSRSRPSWLQDVACGPSYQLDRAVLSATYVSSLAASRQAGADELQGPGYFEPEVVRGKRRAAGCGGASEAV